MSKVFVDWLHRHVSWWMMEITKPLHKVLSCLWLASLIWSDHAWMSCSVRPELPHFLHPRFINQTISVSQLSHPQHDQSWWEQVQESVTDNTLLSKDHVYRMVKERYSNIWPNQTIVSDQSELTILLCQPTNSLLLMKTTLPQYSGLQLLPSYIYDPWWYYCCSAHSAQEFAWLESLSPDSDKTRK